MNSLNPYKSAQGASLDVTSDQAEVALSVIIPCFNEELVLRELYSRVSQVCANAAGGSYEIIIVDDGSSDETRTILKELIETDHHLLGVMLARNHGHQAALTAGLFHARGDRILIMDADLQDPPELLDDMMQLMDEGYDIVYGQRAQRAGESFFKRLSASWFYRLFNSMMDIKIPHDVGDFRLINRRALTTFLSMPEHHRFIRGMMSWMGLRQIPIQYNREERFAGVTKYPLKKMIRFALDGITSFSIIPLRFASYVGVFSSIMSLLVMIYALAAWWQGNTVPGWTSVIVVVLMLGGVQMLMIGIMGEYVGRTYIEVKRRPLFVIDEIVSNQLTPKD